MIRAIIFDFFGVLVGRGFAETYHLAGGDPLADADFIEDLLGQANLGLLTADDFHRQMAARLDISLESFELAVAQAEQPNIELLTYIDQLHGTYKTAILSNANLGTLEQKLDANVLQRSFDALIVSAEVGLLKPDPAIYELAAARLGVPAAECVFIDDQLRYCQGAAAVGMKTITYKDFKDFLEIIEEYLAKY